MRCRSARKIDPLSRRGRGALAVSCATFAIGCWKADPAPLPTDAVAFRPVLGAPDDWVVTTDLLPGLVCPDGDPARFHVVHPVDAADPVPLAVVFHAGSFDHVTDAPDTDPLAGDHHATPDRLGRSFAARQVYATLGLTPSPDPTVPGDGAIATALAEQGVAMLLPEGCWGDLWHNAAETGRHNATSVDGFDRLGLDAARAAWRIASDPAFASANGLVLPVIADPERLLLVGLGEGGHAVSELLWDAPTVTPLAALLDSTADDLSAYTADPDAYADVIDGLDRLFPDQDGIPSTTSLAGAPLPRTAYVYATLDPRIPASSHRAALAALSTASEALVEPAYATAHVVTAADIDVARQVAAYLLATDPIGGDPDSP